MDRLLSVKSSSQLTETEDEETEDEETEEGEEQKADEEIKRNESNCEPFKNSDNINLHKN